MAHCESCGEKYLQSKSNQRYCGRECQMYAYNQLRSARTLTKRSERPPRACGWCGKPVQQERLGRPRQYCNRVCLNQFHYYRSGDEG